MARSPRRTPTKGPRPKPKPVKKLQKRNKGQPQQTRAAPKRRPTILVSSTVYGFEDLLESIYALLDGFGYDVLMSHKGTIPIDPNLAAMDSCLEAVAQCDLFLGVILPRYGSGKETPDAMSITHREVLHAIKLNKPRWFLVHDYVSNARQLLGPMRDESKRPRFVLKDGVPFGSTPILGDLRVLEIYEAAMNLDVALIADRRGNWVQPFGTDDDARLFVTAQFRRAREVLEKHLPKLEDHAAVLGTIKKGTT